MLLCDIILSDASRYDPRLVDSAIEARAKARARTRMLIRQEVDALTKAKALGKQFRAELEEALRRIGL